MLVFINVTLIDGTGSAPRKNEKVLIDGKKIFAVGPNIIVPPDAEVIDLQGRVLMPGLIDAHAHLGDHPFLDGAGLQNAEKSNNYASMRKCALSAGVTTIRSCGDWAPDTRMAADKIEAGELLGPRIICSGRTFMRRDAHPATTVWAADQDTVDNCGAYPLNEEEARRMVREAVNLGMDFIKIVIGDTHIMLWPETFAQLDWDIIEAIIDEAGKCGLSVACHVDHLAQADKAVDLGANEIHHLIAIGSPRYELPEYEKLFRKMCEKNIWLVPTIAVPRVFEQRRLDKGCPTGGVDYCNNVFRTAYEYGVPMGLGCDSGCPGVPWGRSTWEEMMEYVVNLQMTPLEAIRCATFDNARMMGRENEFGSIRAGLCADLLILEKDPSEDIGNIQSLCAVYRAGRKVSLDEI